MGKRRGRSIREQSRKTATKMLIVRKKKKKIRNMGRFETWNVSTILEKGRWKR